MDLLSAARKQSDRLRRLIEDLLTVSRIDNEALPQYPTNVHVEQFITETLRTIPGAEAHAVVTVDPGLHFEVDPDHLDRIVRNIIENAIKYAPDSPIDISASLIGGDPRLGNRRSWGGYPRRPTGFGL